MTPVFAIHLQANVDKGPWASITAPGEEPDVSRTGSALHEHLKNELEGGEQGRVSQQTTYSRSQHQADATNS
ncbi:unnamed protein product [Toxocara canis]|uniref:Uncharacterized protein n=1 Tax=Toxocara canis TaxID=6265 RepID=A0A183V2M3_TOXCA|nr:unnamed protein product [Toxocara canis]